jgi:hypothetical protein
MAKQIIETLIDDIDGSPANSSVTFEVDGLSYTIDLNDKHENELRAKLSPFLEVARRVRTPRGSRPLGRTVGDKERNTAIREWALSEGVELPSRGRIAGAVQDAYDAGDGPALRAAAGIEEEVPEQPKPRSRRKVAAEFSSKG